MGQSIALQSFTQSAGYGLIQSNTIQLDWQLDLGLTTLAWNPSPHYFFTPGFIQPNIYRFSDNNKPSKFDPTILAQFQHNANAILLFSKETDLIFFGYRVFDFSGRLVLATNTKIASSQMHLSIPTPALSNGVYFILIDYLPENIAFTASSMYWIKSLKIIKQ
jgi:hypothetical protein